MAPSGGAADWGVSMSETEPNWTADQRSAARRRGKRSFGFMHVKWRNA